MMSQNGSAWPQGLVENVDPKNLNEIIANAADVVIVISREGSVLSARGSDKLDPAGSFAAWEGMPLKERLSVESIPKFESRLAQFLAGKTPVAPVELNHPAVGLETGFPVRYTFHHISDGESVLMLGRDLGPIWETQQQLIAAQIALERDYETRRHSETMFRVLMAATGEPVVFVNVQSGQITDCNPASEALLGKDKAGLVGRSLMRVLGSRDGTSDFERLVAAATRESTSPLSIDTGPGEQGILISPTMFRTGGERIILCRLTGIGGGAAQSDELYRNLIGLFESGIDGIVFAARDGRVLNANEAFLEQANVGSAEAIKGRSIADFLGRGAVDMNVMFENAGRMGAMRLYATRLVSTHGGRRHVEISTSKLKGAGQNGYVLIIRDANRLDRLPERPDQPEDVDMASLMQLIGSQSLKEIVAKTTDAVEKMCIETAVDMTSNNRVAAAEMLGLSRQSLYVKLRKYGLLKKG